MNCIGRSGWWVVAGLALAAPAAETAEAPPPPAPLIRAEPLAARSGPRGPTLFSIVDPAASGVIAENKYADPEMWGRLSREFDLGGIGTGVAIGDYDGDGRPDLFVVSKTESCRLFRNLGGWRFEDVTERAGVADVGPAARVWKQGATFADVNNDGRLDLYVCRFGAPNLLYINQGDGTFREEAQARGLAVNDASVMAAFGDYDRDGWLDVFVQTNVLDVTTGPEGRRDYLFHNNGDGTFTNVTDRAGVAPRPTHGNSAVWWDFDDDGWPDLYVANDFAVPDALYRNNHDGTFTDVIARFAPRVPYSSMGCDVGDVNNDGRLDLLVSDMAATTHVKDQRTMAETRARMRPPPAGSGEVRQFPYSALLLDTGVGRALEVAHLAGVAATDWTWSPRWEDLDNDGRVDLHVTNGMYREIHNQDLIARRSKATTQAMREQAARNSPVLAESNLAFRNLGDLRFENVSRAWGLDQVGVSFGSAFGDLDGDGDLDLLYSNYQAGPTLLRNDSDTGHRLVIALRGTRSNRFGVGAKVTIETATGVQTRTLTLARGFMSSSEPIVHFGLGENVTVRRLAIRWPSGAEQTFADLAGDRRYTVTEPAAPQPTAATDAPGPVPAERARQAEPMAARNDRSQFVDVSASLRLAYGASEESFDEFLDQRLLPFGLNRRGPALAVGTLGAAGPAAVAIGGTTRQPLRVLVAAPDGTWRERAVPAFAAPPSMDDGPLLFFDAAGRGRADLLVGAGGTSQPAGAPEYALRLYLADGDGGWGMAPADALPPLSISVGALCAADFDGDGRLDVFLGGRVVPGAYPDAPESVLLANRGGRFEDVTDRLAPGLRHIGLVTAAVWCDVDGDGAPDLVLALEWGGVRYLHNGRALGFEDWTERSGFGAAGSGWWRSLAVADFNGDGRPDFAIGNLGLNTPYAADAAHPVRLYVGDFGGRDPHELIEAYEEDGRLYPRRSRLELGAAIPSVLRRFRSNDEYARATLPDIVGAERLAAARCLTATELRSGVLLSQPDGRYVFAPLPRPAQAAPANGMAAVDVDGDGCADLYVLQNSNAPAPAIGAFDGGVSQLLRGDGRGGLTSVSPAESGLVAPGEANALVALDLDGDGWPDFLASRNADPTLAFRNRGVPGRHSLAVRLAGKPGNVLGIGARVVAVYADGRTAMRDVSAGSSIYSQSSAAVFFGWTDANPIRQLSIRWPDGTAAVEPVTANTPSTIDVTGK